MKVHNIFKQAVYNMFRNKTVFFQLFWGMTITLFIIISGTLYIFNINDTIRSSTERILYKAYFYFEQCDMPEPEKRDMIVSDIMNSNVVSCYNIYCYAPPGVMEKSKEIFKSSYYYDNYDLIIGDKRYIFNVEETEDIMPISSAGIVLKTYEEGTAMISDNLIKAYTYKYGNGNILVSGSMPQRAGEILLTEVLLEMYGVPESEYNSFIGETFCLFNKELGKEVYEYTVSGVLKKEACEMDDCLMSVYYPERVENEMTVYLFELNGYDSKELKTLFTDIKQRYGVELTTSYAFDTLKSLNSQKRFSEKTVTVIMLIIFLSSMVSISIFLELLTVQKKHMTAIYLSQGMTPKMVIAIRLTELIIVFLISDIISSITAYWAVSKLNEKINGSMYIDTNVSLNTAFFASALIVIAITVAVSLVYTIILYKNICNKSVVSLMR